MPLMNPALMSPEMLRNFVTDLDAGRAIFAKSPFFNLDSKMFYCPTCDQMVTIAKPIARFRPKPWRDDVFKWRT